MVNTKIILGSLLRFFGTRKWALNSFEVITAAIMAISTFFLLYKFCLSSNYKKGPVVHSRATISNWHFQIMGAVRPQNLFILNPDGFLDIDGIEPFFKGIEEALAQHKLDFRLDKLWRSKILRGLATLQGVLSPFQEITTESLNKLHDQDSWIFTYIYIKYMTQPNIHAYKPVSDNGAIVRTWTWFG